MNVFEEIRERAIRPEQTCKLFWASEVTHSTYACFDDVVPIRAGELDLLMEVFEAAAAKRAAETAEETYNGWDVDPYIQAVYDATERLDAALAPLLVEAETRECGGKDERIAGDTEAGECSYEDRPGRQKDA